MNTNKFNKYYKSNDHFRIENPNPRWAKQRGMIWNGQDCVIRALANAMSVDWVTAYDYLAERGRRDFYAMNDSNGFRKWVQEDGAKWVACKAEKGKRRITVEQFVEQHPAGRFVIYIAGHFTSCVDGVLLDVMNCGFSAVVGYFDMQGFKM